MSTDKTALAAAIALLALSSVAASAAEYPILDAPPGLSAAARSSYSAFLLMNEPRALAFGSNGAYGWYGGAANIGEARQKALASCAAKGASDCAIYAEDLQVLSHPVTVPVQGPLAQQSGYALVPDPRYFWRGPASAAGVYVWAHGTSSGQDSRGREPQAHVRAFNNDGFDVVRFDRDPSTDYADRAAAWLRDSATTLHKMGYRKIILGGQSRGAWNALQALSVPGLVDGVVAVSPASVMGSSLYLERAELQRLLAAANAPQARVAVVQFSGDQYAGDLDQRISDLRSGLASRVGALMVIDRPAGFQGHGAGESGPFAIRFAPCIYRFIQGGEGCPAGTQVSTR